MIKTKLTKEFILHHIGLLTIVIFISILIAIFAGILEDVWTHDPEIIAFDIAMLKSIESIRTPFLTEFFLSITKLGDKEILIPLILIALALLSFSKKPKYFFTLVGSVIGYSTTVAFLKEIIQRSRPEITNALILENGFSFPSGHAFISIGFFGVLTFIVLKFVKNKLLRYLIIIFSIILIPLIGASRLYLGVHWFSDVIASYLLGLALFIILVVLSHNYHKILDYIKKARRRAVLQ